MRKNTYCALRVPNFSWKHIGGKRESDMRNHTILPKNPSDIQEFDLLNDEVFQEQEENTRKYQQKSLAGKIGFVLFGVAGYSLLFFRNNDFLGFVAMGGMILAVIGSLFARCPHCNSLQPGRIYGLSFSRSSLLVSYEKGVWPFASRCVKCGYYLSSRKLKKDKLQQPKESDATTTKGADPKIKGFRLH